jgi:RNA polymerase sigma factor (sigma-70 family)
VNLARNHFRRLKLERAYLEALAHESARQTMLPDIVSEEVIRSALLALPFRQRAAIVLRYFEDLPEQRVAELLSCRPGTVKSLLSRGVAAIRTNTAAQLEAEHDG